MPRALLRLAIATALFGACGGNTPAPVKPVKKEKTKDKDVRALLAEARDAAQEKDVETADKAYGKAYAISKEFEIVEERVDFLIHAGKAARAAEAAKEYYDDNISDVKGFRLYADALLAGNKGKDAEVVADALIALDEKDPSGYEKKGRALLLQDKSDEAIEQLRKATQLDDQSHTYHLQLGIALLKLGKVDEAGIKFKAALNRSADDPMIHVYLGAARRAQGELKEAKQLLDRALELDPDNGRAYFELGLLYNQQQKQADSQVALEAAVQKSPHESQYWYALGEIYRLQDRAADAIRAYEKANDLDPPYPKAIGKLASLLVDAKKYDDAEAVLTPAVRRDPKNHVNYLYLGAVYAAKGQKRVAIENYEKYLELAPKNDPEINRAKAAIRDLRRR